MDVQLSATSHRMIQVLGAWVRPSSVGALYAKQIHRNGRRLHVVLMVIDGHELVCNSFDLQRDAINAINAAVPLLNDSPLPEEKS